MMRRLETYPLTRDDDMNLRVRRKSGNGLPCIFREERHRLERVSVRADEPLCGTYHRFLCPPDGAFGTFDKRNDKLTSNLDFDMSGQALAEILEGGRRVHWNELKC